jgi:hypothetical protein
MKTADILAAMKATGGRLLKDSDPELYKAELEGGASISFQPSTPTKRKRSVATSPTIQSTPEGLQTSEYEMSDDQPHGELCPFCGHENLWGSMQTCTHNVGVVIDSNMLDSIRLNSIWSSWSELCAKDVQLTPIAVLRALARHLKVDDNSVVAWHNHAEEGHHDLGMIDFINLCIEVFALEVGSVQVTDGMLSGSSYCLYVPNPEALDDMDAMLKMLMTDLKTVREI